MTIQELYAKIGANYEQATRVMRMDKLIDRYIRKLSSSGVWEALQAAGQAMDPTKLFEAAHAMKGVCANLGLDELAQLAGEITEEYRPGATRTLTDDEVKARLQKVDEVFAHVMAGIKEYEQQ